MVCEECQRRGDQQWVADLVRQANRLCDATANEEQAASLFDISTTLFDFVHFPATLSVTLSFLPPKERARRSVVWLRVMSLQKKKSATPRVLRPLTEQTEQRALGWCAGGRVFLSVGIHLLFFLIFFFVFFPQARPARPLVTRREMLSSGLAPVQFQRMLSSVRFPHSTFFPRSYSSCTQLNSTQLNSTQSFV